MTSPPGAHEAVRELLRAQRLAVLCTQGGGQPYASLVAVAETEDLTDLYFATPRATRKYANLTAERRVALLADSRSNRESDFREATAATATGVAQEVEGAEREAGQALLLAKHPHLAGFVSSPECALFRVRVETYVVVRRFQDVVTLRVGG